MLLNLASLVVADRLNACLSNEMRLPNIVVLTNFVIVVSASLVVADRLNACLSNEMRLPNIIQLS